ncbi:YdcF family protein [Clostridium sp. 2-1]|uniref:YdcF family protein n=1 Tax=Clostridium TaxID=1485 RepID=UPI000CDAEB72|nr:MULTISPECIES: YdcF family protein [Clostridium]MBN7574612.1 YdcF family protein [Clostridium beijerinckii]MBN7579575.1 YdcF family protein [Clostridium beijerinckii]MBN7584173.1 YdcF family protein [Clostridium beijerinckii]MBO0520115.1 YdcF family protein [Clostridium beijerinckii]POO89053.1 YdcF family protein [Clostridium sp. 2-1]
MKIRYMLSELWIAFGFPIIVLGIIILVYYFSKKIMKKNMFFYKIFRYIKISSCIIFICFIIIEALIINYPKYNRNSDDYIIVLGAGLDNGGVPNLILRERLDIAIKCMKENLAQYIVLSGGQGTDESTSEAQAMSEYLQAKGIEKNKIILEDKSRDTNENLKYSKEKIEESSSKSISDIKVKIVTTDFHAFRSSVLAKKNGYKNFDNYSSTMPWYFVPSTYARESIAVIKSILLDK